MSGLSRLLGNASLLTVAILAMGTSAASAFSDVDRYWANGCINQLAAQQLVSGYPDGTFRPNAVVTRAEFAILMLNAFPEVESVRNAPAFNDVLSRHWAFRAIRDAYEREFFSGYPDGSFRPAQAIPRVQAIAILANASHYTTQENPDAILQRYFDDAQQIPAYARRAIAAGTVGRLAVNYPNVRQLKPNQGATRGEVAAFLCQSLNLAQTIPLQYVAGDSALFAIPPEVGGVYPFSEGLTVAKIGGKYGFIDTNGAIVIPAQYDGAQPFKEGLAAVLRGDRWGFIDRSGNWVIPAQFSNAPDPFSDGLARVYMGQAGTGFIDRTGQFVIEPQPHLVFSFSEGLAAIAIDGKYGFIDKTGAVVIEPQFYEAKPFAEGLAPVRIQSSNFSAYWGYIDKTGNVVIPAEFYRAQPFSEGLAGVYGNAGWAYIDRQGAVVISGEFRTPDRAYEDAIAPFSEGVAMVRLGERVGFIDRTGRFVIEPQYPDATSFSDGLARVNVAGTWITRQSGYTHMNGPEYTTELRGGRWGYIRLPR